MIIERTSIFPARIRMHTYLRIEPSTSANVHECVWEDTQHSSGVSQRVKLLTATAPEDQLQQVSNRRKVLLNPDSKPLEATCIVRWSAGFSASSVPVASTISPFGRPSYNCTSSPLLIVPHEQRQDLHTCLARKCIIRREGTSSGWIAKLDAQ